MLMRFEKVVEALKRLFPENVLLFARRVVDAEPTVIEPPRETLEPLTVTDEFCNWLLPMVELATTCPEPLTVRIELESPVNQVVPRVVSDEDDWLRFTMLENVVEAENKLLPLNVLLFARSVVDA